LLVIQLFQKIISQLFSPIFFGSISVDTEGTTKIIFERTIVADIMMIFGIGLIIYRAYISYRFIEMPLNQYRHKFKVKKDVEIVS